MYFKIWLSPKDRPYHKFLWRNLDLGKPPCEYEFNSEEILQSTYMDDTMDSVENDSEGIALYKSLSELWKKAGMHTHKWLSNSPAVLKEIPPHDRACKMELSGNPWSHVGG